jgi:hypothetical protein
MIAELFWLEGIVGDHQILNFGAYLLNTSIAFGVGTNAFGLNKRLGIKTNKEVSDKYETAVTPAGFTFSIWGVIYSLEGAFVVWQLQSMMRNDAMLLDLSPSWQLASISTACWALAFGAEQIPIAAACISGVAYGMHGVYSTVAAHQASSFWLVRLPTAMHFAWVSAATLIQYNGLAAYMQLSPSALRQIGVASEFVAVAFASLNATRYGDPIIPFVTSWALAGVSMRQADDLSVHIATPNQRKTLSMISGALAVVMAGLGAYLCLY